MFGVNMLILRNIINDKFWTEVWDMTGIVSSASVTMDTSVKMNEIPEWFPGARLNYAENLLRSV